MLEEPVRTQSRRTRRERTKRRERYLNGKTTDLSNDVSCDKLGSSADSTHRNNNCVKCQAVMEHRISVDIPNYNFTLQI